MNKKIFTTILTFLIMLVAATSMVWSDILEWPGDLMLRSGTPLILYDGTLAFQNKYGTRTNKVTMDQSGNVTVAGTLAVTGAVTPAAITDISKFYPATSYCRSDTATQQNGLIPVRVAANDWAIARTAGGAETINIVCNLAAPYRTTASKGWKLTGFKIVQQITVAALTSNTFNALSTVTYANNAANAVAAYGGSITITMPTATQANPYVTVGTVGTPAFMTTADSQVNMDFTTVLQNTGVYRLYGVVGQFTQQL